MGKHVCMGRRMDETRKDGIVIVIVVIIIIVLVVAVKKVPYCALSPEMILSAYPSFDRRRNSDKDAAKTKDKAGVNVAGQIMCCPSSSSPKHVTSSISSPSPPSLTTRSVGVLPIMDPPASAGAGPLTTHSSGTVIDGRPP